MTKSLNIDAWKCEVFDEPGPPAVARDEHIRWLMELTPDDGIHLEFGVFRGLTINVAASCKPPTTQFYGFDSFTGLPEDWDLGDKVVKAEVFNRQGDIPTVPDNVTLIHGFFEDTLNKFRNKHLMVVEADKTRPRKVEFIHVDCDIYSSTKTVLTELNDHIQPGTILLFDELIEWRLVLEKEFDRPPFARYTTWKDHEWKALIEWLDEFDRIIEPISRTWHQATALRVFR